MKTTFKTVEEGPATFQASHVADVLGLSRGGAYNLMNSEGFPAIRIGKRLIVTKTAFIKWLEENAGKTVNIKELGDGEQSE